MGSLKRRPLFVESPTMSSRYILVDDTDARIEYGGDQWFLGRNQDIGSFGPVWNNTLHGVISNASLSFTYNGVSSSYPAIDILSKPKFCPDCTYM
jgi:hypothetical protein